MARGAFRLLEMLYVRMDPPQGIEEAQERFLEAERSMLEQRRNGSLAQAIGEPLSGESPEELWWLVVEDQHLAEEGLVKLRSGERQEGLAHAAACEGS